MADFFKALFSYIYSVNIPSGNGEAESPALPCADLDAPRAAASFATGQPHLARDLKGANRFSAGAGFWHAELAWATVCNHFGVLYLLLTLEPVLQSHLSPSLPLIFDCPTCPQIAPWQPCLGSPASSHRRPLHVRYSAAISACEKGLQWQMLGREGRRA